MCQAERLGLLAKEQYGSQNQKSAAIQCLNKRLVYDHLRFTWQPLTLCSNDTKSCIDQIVLIIAALCLCCLGASKLAVQSMLSTLDGMEYHLCSTFGDSTISQSRKDWQAQIAGIGQGNGASPPIWAAVSMPLFHALTMEGLIVATFICALSGHHHNLAGFDSWMIWTFVSMIQL